MDVQRPLAVIDRGRDQLVILRQHLGLSRDAVRNRHDIEVVVAVWKCGHVRQARAVRGPLRLDLDRDTAGQRARRAVANVEQPQMDFFIGLGRVSDPVPVRRPGRHRVVTRARGQLVGGAFTETHVPDRALHGESDLLAVGRPGREVRAIGDLRQVALQRVRLAGHDAGENAPLRLGCTEGGEEEQAKEVFPHAP